MTEVSGYTTDSATKTGIPGATVDLMAGNVILKRVMSDGNGAFSINTDSVPDRMVVSSVGYQTKEFKMPEFAGYFSFELDRSVKPLPGVTVTATLRPNKNGFLVLLVIGLLIAAKNK